MMKLSKSPATSGHWEESMATQDKDKWEGRGKEAGGKVKETAGKVTGDKNLEADGKGDQGKGKVQETFGKVKEKVKDATS
jgi:uncharacterized protein YjbJ (UPF0337 family)